MRHTISARSCIITTSIVILVFGLTNAPPGSLHSSTLGFGYHPAGTNYVPAGNAGTAAPDDVPAGFDLFETDPKKTEFEFKDDFVIPAGFFDPGSEPFKGKINFQGQPIGIFMGHPVGTTDTIVRRNQSAILPPIFPSEDTIPIELVALSLVSVSPITVKIEHGPAQMWDVGVTVSPLQPSMGEMTIKHTNQMGGTFDSEFKVLPKFTFVRVGGNGVRMLDVGALPLGEKEMKAVTLRAKKVPWVHTCPPDALMVPGLNDNFCASATAEGRVLTEEEAKLAKHAIRPAQSQLPSPMGPLFPDDCLPPVDSKYVGVFHAACSVPGLGVINLSNPVHDRFTRCDPPPKHGQQTTHTFGSVVQGLVTVPPGQTFPFQAPGTVTVRVTFNREDHGVRFFDTEMLQLDISGGTLPPQAMMRESPSLPSMGQTTIQRVPHGNFRIDSFFDVFPEVSLDGGHTFHPCQQGRVTLQHR